MSESAIPEFGIKRENEERRDGGCGVIFDPESQKYAVGKRASDGLLLLFAGGVNEGESIEDGVRREVEEESGLHEFLYTEKIAEALTHYRNKAKEVNRLAHATCFLFVLKSRDLIPVRLEEHENFTLHWATVPEIVENWESRNQDEGLSHWIYFLGKAVARAIELGYDRN